MSSTDLPTVRSNENLPVFRADWRRKMIAGQAAKKKFDALAPSLAQDKRDKIKPPASIADREQEHQLLLNAIRVGAHAEQELANFPPPLVKQVLDEREARRRALAAAKLQWESRLEHCPDVKRAEFQRNFDQAERDHDAVLDEIVALKARCVNEDWPEPTQQQLEQLQKDMARFTRSELAAATSATPQLTALYGSPSATPEGRAALQTRPFAQ